MRSHRALLARYVVVELLLGSGCAYYSQSDGERLRDEVFALKTQLTALQQKLKALETEETASRKKLAQIASDVSELNTAARRNDADIGVVLDVVRQDVARMKGEVELLTDRLSEVEGQAEKTQEELELRFQTEDEIRAAATEREKALAEEAARKRQALLSKPKDALDEAEKLIESGQPADARSLVRALEIEQRGSSAWKIYAPRAQYLIGETYFAEKDYKQAVAAFNVVRKKYKGSKTWLPGSILKLGLCFDKLGLKEDAQLFYERVSTKYPRHPAGQEGKRLLRALQN